jgi:hypothetical protein
MLKKGLFFFLMTLLVFGLAAPALAVSTMTGEVNFYNFSINIDLYYGGEKHVINLPLEYRSKLYGEAYYRPYEKFAYDTSYQTTPTSIVFAESASWITSMSTYNNTTPGQMSAQFSGIAGYPDPYYAGGLHQNAFFIFHSQFTVPDGGSAYVESNLRTNYSYSFSIQNAASGNYFTSAGFGIAWSIYANDENGYSSWSLQPIKTLTSGSLSPGESLVLAETALFTDYPGLAQLGPGTYEFWVPISVGYSGYTATSPVPLPSTVLLLSSGLLGLVGWRRFRKS